MIQIHSIVDMNESLENKVRTASKAGWKVLSIFFAILVVQYILYLNISQANGSLLLSLLGKGVSWEQIQTLWIWMMSVYKVCFLILLILNLWITIWANELRKQS